MDVPYSLQLARLRLVQLTWQFSFVPACYREAGTPMVPR